MIICSTITKNYYVVPTCVMCYTHVYTSRSKTETCRGEEYKEFKEFKEFKEYKLKILNNIRNCQDNIYSMVS